MEGTWKFLGPSNHMHELLVCHAGEQCHHGDLGVGSAHLLSGAEHWGLSTLKQEENLKNQQYNKVEPERRNSIVAIHSYLFFKMDLNDPRSPHLVRTHVNYRRRLPSSTGTAAAVLPLVLRGRCSALQDTRHLVSVAGCSSLFVAPHHAAAILAHALIEKKKRGNMKPAIAAVE